MKKFSLLLLFIIFLSPINKIISSGSDSTKNKSGLSDEAKVTIMASSSAIGAILLLFLGRLILEGVRNSNFFENWGLKSKSRAAYKEWLEQLTTMKAGQIDQILTKLDQFIENGINQKDLKNIARSIVDLNLYPGTISDSKINQLNTNIERLIINNVKGIKPEDLNLIKQDVVKQLVDPNNGLNLHEQLIINLKDSVQIPQQEAKVAAELLPGQMPNVPEPVQPFEPADAPMGTNQPADVGVLDIGKVEVEPFKPLDVAPPGGLVVEYKPVVEPVGL